MKSAQGFSTILLVIGGAILIFGGLIFYASTLPRGTKIGFGSKYEKELQATSTKTPTDGKTVDSSIAISDKPIEYDTKEEFYTIKGSTLIEIQKAIENHGPTLETDQEGVANCKTGYEWSLGVKSSKTECQVTGVPFKVHTVCSYPKWEQPAGVDQSVVNSWNYFMDKVRLHENGHADIGKKLGQQLYEQIKKLPSAPTCDEIKKSGEKLMADTIAQDNQENKQYDIDTVHGETQGAVLIPQ